MRTSTFLTVVGIFSMAASGLALAANQYQIGQKGRVFSQEKLTISVGESVAFINDDTVPHNIMSVSADNEFNLGSQAPGVSIPVTFDKAGNVSVICAIHPRMKLDIVVK